MQTFLHSFSVRNIKNKHLRCSTGQEVSRLLSVTIHNPLFSSFSPFSKHLELCGRDSIECEHPMLLFLLKAKRKKCITFLEYGNDGVNS